ncbi:MAG: sigma-70 family RNA polymerase sigma factor [Desulfobulbaceae bacterium]|nr:sigma-70 family RNA polymerase sigma factor [Desulfobulbaceae bacterium]
MDQPDPHSDVSLIARLVAGENLALDTIMKRYQEPIFFFVLRYVHDEDLAYDLVQETFFRVYTRAASYNPEYRFTTWLYQIALNLCRDHGRKQALRKFFSLSNSETGKEAKAAMVHNAHIEKNYEMDHDISELQQEITKLPHKLKTTLILFTLEENSQLACSEILGISQKAVETRVYRAKKILKQKMTKRFEGKR